MCTSMFAFSAYGASTDFDIVSEDFDGYTVGDNNLMGSGDVLPGALFVSKTVDVGGVQQPYSTTENGIYITDDETDSDKGKVLKLVSDNDSVFPEVNYYKPMADRSIGYSHEDGKLLSISMDMYFDRETVMGYKLNPDNRSKYVVNGQTKSWPCLTQVNMGFLSVMATSSFATRHNAMMTVAFDNDKAASWEDDSYVPVYLNTRGTAAGSENAGSMATATAKFNLPTDEWFKLTIIFDLNALDKTNHKVPLSVYVNNECKVKDHSAIIPTGNDGYEFEKVYRGLVFSPQAFVASDNKGVVKPVMYVDDITTSYLSAYEPDITFEENNNDVANYEVTPNSKVNVTFEDDIAEEIASVLTANGAVKVYDANGKQLAISDLAVNGNVLSFIAADGFEYNRDYTLEIVAADLYNSRFVKYKGVKSEFSTQKAKGAYITAASVSPTGSDSIDTATSVTAEIETNIPTGVVAAVYKNGEFKGAKYVNTLNDSEVTFDGSADYVKLFVVDESGKSVWDTMTLNPLDKDIAEDSDFASSSEIKLSVLDAKDSKIKLTGSTGKNGNNQYGRIEIYKDKKDAYSDNAVSDAVYADDIAINEKGQIAKSFAFKGDSGKYYAWVIANDVEECVDFEYASYADLISLISKLAVTDSANNAYIAKGRIFEEVAALGYGFGIDFEEVYSSARDKDLFAYRIDKVRVSLTDGGEENYIANFIAEEKKVEKELTFLKALENPLQKGQIEFLLKDNTDITGMNFVNYPNVPSETYDAFIGATFASADDVKPFFETALANALDDDDNSSNSSGGKGSSSGWGSKPSTITIEQMQNAFNNANANSGNNDFVDLANVPWAKDAINALRDKKIINGVTATEFAPEATVTRAQIVKMLMLASGKADFDAECNFEGLSKENWSYVYVAAAVKAGVVKGITDTDFGGDLNVTRQDVAVMISRILGTSNEDANLEEIKNDTTIFADMSAVSDYALAAVKSLKDSQLILGRDNNTFAPHENMTRAEAAVIINRLVDLLNKQ